MRSLVGLFVCTLLALAFSSPASAQALNPQFLGDHQAGGDKKDPAPQLLPGMAPSSYNSRKREGLALEREILKDFQPVTFPDGTTDDLLSPEEFIKYLESRPDNKTVRSPPDNKVIAIDMLAWEAMSPAERAANVIKRPVKRTRTYTVARPILQERTYITYPCCCPETVQVQVGVTYETKTEIINETEPAGADYPTVEVNLPRDVAVVPDSNSAKYQTSVPQYACSGSAADSPVRPLIPLQTDQRDGLTVSPGSTVGQNEGIAATSQDNTSSVQLGSAVYDCGVFVACTPDGSPFSAGGVTTTTYNGTTLEKAAVNAKIPLADPDKGAPMPAGTVDTPGAGLNTFATDTSKVKENTVLQNATADPLLGGDKAPNMILKTK